MKRLISHTRSGASSAWRVQVGIDLTGGDAPLIARRSQGLSKALRLTTLVPLMDLRRKLLRRAGRCRESVLITSTCPVDGLATREELKACAPRSSNIG